MELSIHDCENGYFLLDRNKETGKIDTVFESRYIVTLRQFVDKEPLFPLEQTEYWDKVAEKYCSFETCRTFIPSEEKVRIHDTYESMGRLQTYVIHWLNDNVENSTDSKREWKQGWDYHHSKNVDINIFFLRKRDALKFIKNFSESGEPSKIYDKRKYK